jgi:hypothetical protein
VIDVASVGGREGRTAATALRTARVPTTVVGVACLALGLTGGPAVAAEHGGSVLEVTNLSVDEERLARTPDLPVHAGRRRAAGHGGRGLRCHPSPLPAEAGLLHGQ